MNSPLISLTAPGGTQQKDTQGGEGEKGGGKGGKRRGKEEGEGRGGRRGMEEGREMEEGCVGEGRGCRRGGGKREGRE